MKLSGWGNFPVIDGVIREAQTQRDAERWLTKGPSLIPRGAGRAYGDAALGAEQTLSMVKFDRFVAWNPDTRELTVEAGVMLADIIATMLPMGYFPPVVPGTQFVTAGGMAAANVHGKNHHAVGGFGRHVTRLKVLTADGRVTACDITERPDLFHATIGGMGLTGIILEVTFRLVPVETAYIRQETLTAPNLDGAMKLLEESSDWTYAVGWIDCLAGGAALGRSLIYRGEHARRDELDAERRKSPLQVRPPRALSVPLNLPNFTLNKPSVTAFNWGYYHLGASREGTALTGPASFFFPLDSVAHWNRIYGARGFIQHQCVVPKSSSREAIGDILDIIQRLGTPSFLAVLKLLGPDDHGLMGFPMEGYTLAVDFAVGDRTDRMTTELDRVVTTYGGRLYLAKDARQTRATLDAGYPNVERFRTWRRESGSADRFRSLQSERLGL